MRLGTTLIEFIMVIALMATISGLLAQLVMNSWRRSQLHDRAASVHQGQNMLARIRNTGVVPPVLPEQWQLRSYQDDGVMVIELSGPSDVMLTTVLALDALTEQAPEIP